MPPSRGRIDRAAIPENGNHLSQDLIVPERAILVGKRIAAGDETIAAFADEPVRYKTMVAVAQHDLPWKQLRGAFPADGEDVARPHGREHAGSGDLQAHFSELAGDLRD
jgi:hypothetical protein